MTVCPAFRRVFLVSDYGDDASSGAIEAAFHVAQRFRAQDVEVYHEIVLLSVSPRETWAGATRVLSQYISH